MIPLIPKLLLILKEACEKYGFEWTLIDNYSNNLVEVSSGNNSFFATNSKVGTYPINSHFAAQLAIDKSWMNKVLVRKGYKVPKGDYFFLRNEYRELRGDGKEYADALNYARDKYPVFVKPNSGSLGINAEIVSSEKELKIHLAKIAPTSWIATIQEIIKLPEYRIFAVDGEVQFVYQRNAAQIVGDGKRKVSELITEINKAINRKKNHISEDSAYLSKELQKRKLNFNSVLADGEIIQVVSKTNISSGGSITNYSEDVSDKTRDWVRRLLKDISLRVSGVDIFSSKSIDDPDGFTIIEINSSPSLVGIYELGHKETVLNIWKEILKKYFDN